MALIVAAVLLGGGGVRYGFANLLVQLCALTILAFHRQSFCEFWQKAPLAIRLLVGASLLLPALQLVPLPQDLLRIVPSREDVIEALVAAGSNQWFPVSVDPARTLVALIGLIVPVAILTIGWRLPTEDLVTLGWTIVALGMVSLVLGSIQVLSSGQYGLFFPENPMPGVLFGTFANRNSAGIFMVSAAALCGLLPSPSNRPAFAFARATMVALLLVAVLLTQSRSAIVLAAVLVAVLFAKALGKLRKEKGMRTIALFATAFTLAASIATIGLVSSQTPGKLTGVVERFEARSDARAYIWDDASYAAKRYWPVGTGMGTFDEVFQANESLEHLSQRRAGRAHNDYLEIAIEAGLPGLMIIVGWAIFLGWASWRVRRSQWRWTAWAGSAILLAIAAQSVTDYPLRNQAMLAVASLAVLMLGRLGLTTREVDE